MVSDFTEFTFWQPIFFIMTMIHYNLLLLDDDSGTSNGFSKLLFYDGNDPSKFTFPKQLQNLSLQVIITVSIFFIFFQYNPKIYFFTEFTFFSGWSGKMLCRNAKRKINCKRPNIT